VQFDAGGWSILRSSPTTLAATAEHAPEFIASTLPDAVHDYCFGELNVPASIFLSYASEDREPARSIGDALSKLGVDVWLDESELGGGDAWDQKIRKQIRECDYFMPIVSAQTESRHEGYFRREWRLAVERTLDMADDHLFLLPVVIDETEQSHARVPEKFLAVQWLRVPGGRPTPALEALCHRILSGDPPTEPPQTAPKKPPRQNSAAPARVGPSPYPPFPREEAGQRARFWAHVLGWTGRSAWISFLRVPRWIRILIYVWVAILVMSRGCTPGSHDRSEISRADAQKLKAIAESYRGSTRPDDIAKLGAQVANQFSDGAAGSAGKHTVLAIPFSAPEGDSSGGKLADAAFAQAYGRLSVSHRGEVGLDKGSLPSDGASAALMRAREAHSDYVIYGAVRDSAQALTVTIAKVQDGSVLWTQSYPVATADPTKIAEEIDSKVPGAAPDDD
jgi:TolB-like protein